MTTKTESQTAESTHDSTLQNPLVPDASVKGRKIRNRRKTVTSEKKIEANRRNALRSTGARTKRGKRNSSHNALRFGLYAGPQLLPGESYEEHRALLHSLANDLKPQGPIEEMYITQIEWDMRWLKRFAVAEHAFITGKVDAITTEMGDGTSESLRISALRRVLAEYICQSVGGIDDKLNRQRKQRLGDIKQNLEALQECQLHRAMEIESQLSERRIRTLENRRFLPAQEDSAGDADEGCTPRPRRSIAQSD